uniref:Uncharacterized protein n=1 Tax=Ixodes ricinus TaxID=34613 RepID=A0A6B0TSN3_IXORI
MVRVIFSSDMVPTVLKILCVAQWCTQGKCTCSVFVTLVPLGDGKLSLPMGRGLALENSRFIFDATTNHQSDS